MPTPDGKISAFFGNVGGLSSLNTLTGAVTLNGTLGFTVPRAGNILTVTPPQDLRITASPAFSQLTTAHFINAQTSGAENYGVATLVDQTASDIDGPRVGYHRTLASGDKYWSIGFKHGLDNLDFAVYENNDPTLGTGGYGQERLTITNHTSGTPTPVNIDNTGILNATGLTSFHNLLAQTTGAENYGIAAIVEQTASAVDGPRLAFHRTLAAGNKYWSIGFRDGLDDPDFFIHDNNNTTTGGYGTPRVRVIQRGGTSPDLVTVDAIGGMTLGSTTHGGQGILVKTAGAFNNTNDYSPVTGLLGAGATSATDVLKMFYGTTTTLRKEAAVIGCVVNNSSDTNCESNAVMGMAVSNVAAGGNGQNVVAGSFFAQAKATNAAVWSINTLTMDYTNFDPSTRVAASLNAYELDMHCSHLSSQGNAISSSLVFQTPGFARPTTPGAFSCYTIASIKDSHPLLEGFFDYGFKSVSGAADVGLYIGGQPFVIGNASQTIEIVSGNTRQYMVKSYADSSGTFIIQPNSGSNTNKFKIDNAGNVTIDNGLTVTGPFTFATNVNRYRPVGVTLRTVNRNVGDKLAESTSIADFGVLGNGSDESTAVQEAFNTMAVNGGWLRIPAGMYISLGAQITIPSNLRVIGDGANLCGFIRHNLFGVGGAVYQSAMFVALANTTNVEFIGFSLNGKIGDNVTGALASTAVINYSSYIPAFGGSSNPQFALFGTHSTIWIANGCSNMRFEDLTFMYTGGYAINAFAGFSGNITDIFIRHCSFLNNRPGKATPTGSSPYYGTWNGGVLFHNDGTSAYCQNIHVENCVWKRCTGNCFWTHSDTVSNTLYYHRDIYFEGNYGEDVALDFTQPGGGMIGYSETNNRVMRCGYMVLDDPATTRVAAWYGSPTPGQSQIPVAFDTAGQVFEWVRSDNYAEVNGQMFDFDGAGDGSCNGNVFVSPFVTLDKLALHFNGFSYDTTQLGPSHLLNQNWTKFCVMNNSNGITGVGQRIIFEGNESYGAGGGFVLGYGAQHCKITNNLIDHPANYVSAPVILGNLSSFHALDNDVIHNTFRGTVGSSSGPAIAEDPNGFTFSASDINRVRGNVFTTAVFYEFGKDPNSSSTTDILVVSSTSSQPNGIVETHFLTQGTNTATFQTQIWSNSVSGIGASPTGTQMMTITPVATFVPALGIGSSGIIDSARNVGPCNFVEIRKDINGTLGPILRMTNGLGSSSAAIDFYSYSGVFSQTVPTTRYLMADTGSFSGDHVFYTEQPQGSPNGASIERFRIRSGGDINFNGNSSTGVALQINGGTVINTSGQWVGGFASAIINATSAFEMGGVIVIDNARNMFANSYNIGTTIAIDSNRSASLNGLTCNLQAFFNYSGLYSLSAANANFTTVAVNGTQVFNILRDLTCNSISTNAGTFGAVITANGGVNCGSQGISCGGINVSGSQGQNRTITFTSPVTFSVSGIGGTFTKLIFLGGILVNWN